MTLKIKSCKTISVKPGDTVVLNISREPNQREEQNLRTCLRQAFPENKIVILLNGQDLEVKGNQ